MSVKLLLDLGNTRLKAWRVRLVDGEPPAWLDRVVLDAALADFNADALPLEGVEEMVLSAVGRRDWRHQLALVAERRGIELRELSVQRQGIEHCYERVESLGVDRWLGLLAARRHVQGASLVVDAGTAVTLDVLDAEGRHGGGMIVPGVRTMRRSLHEGTADLPVVDGWSVALGSATEAAIAAGTLRAVVALVESVYREQLDMRGVLTLVLSGGDGEAVYNALTVPARLEVDWVAEGMLQALSLSESE